MGPQIPLFRPSPGIFSWTHGCLGPPKMPRVASLGFPGGPVGGEHTQPRAHPRQAHWAQAHPAHTLGFQPRNTQRWRKTRQSKRKRKGFLIFCDRSDGLSLSCRTQDNPLHCALLLSSARTKFSPVSQHKCSILGIQTKFNQPSYLGQVLWSLSGSVGILFEICRSGNTVCLSWNERCAVVFVCLVQKVKRRLDHLSIESLPWLEGVVSPLHQQCASIFSSPRRSSTGDVIVDTEPCFVS